MSNSHCCFVCCDPMPCGCCRRMPFHDRDCADNALRRARPAIDPQFDPRPLTLESVARVNWARCERWHEDTPTWSGADWSNAMAGEAGETCNVVKKLRRIECGLEGGRAGPTKDELMAMLADEIADTYLYLDLLATYYGIDITAAVRSKFNRVSEREGFPERLR